MVQSNTLPRALTVPELARVLRTRKSRVAGWIRDGSLKAINVADPLERPRLVVLPDALAAFTAARTTAPTPKPARRKRQSQVLDFYPD